MKLTIDHFEIRAAHDLMGQIESYYYVVVWSDGLRESSAEDYETPEAAIDGARSHAAARGQEVDEYERGADRRAVLPRGP